MRLSLSFADGLVTASLEPLAHRTDEDEPSRSGIRVWPSDLLPATPDPGPKEVAL